MHERLMRRKMNRKIIKIIKKKRKIYERKVYCNSKSAQFSGNFLGKNYEIL